MNEEPLAQLLDIICDRIIDRSSFIKDPSNVIIGESYDLLNKSEDKFPRAEILIKKEKGDGYADQRIMSEEFRIQIGCHILRPTDVYTRQDMLENVRFGTEVKNIVYGLHFDRMNGRKVCDGFQQMSGFPEIWYEHELFPRVSSSIILIGAEVQLLDNYTNN